MKSTHLLSLLILPLVLVACSAEKPPLQDNTEGLTTTAVQADTPDIQGKHLWDPHIFPSALSKEPYYSSACALADAINDYSPTLPLSDAEIGQALADNFFYSYPPSALCDLSYENGEIRITYELSEKEHTARITKFARCVESILDEALTGEETEEQAILALYRYVAKNVSYFSVDYTAKQTSAFNGLLHKVTICYGFADSFNYLARQAGFQAELLRGCRAADRAEHGWSLVKIGEETYHFDPTWEHSGTNGEGIRYFGMNDMTRYEHLSDKVGDSLCGFGTLEKTYLPGSNTSTKFALWNRGMYSAGGYTWADLESLLR